MGASPTWEPPWERGLGRRAAAAAGAAGGGGEHAGALDREHAAVRYRVAAVERQVDQDVFQLAGVDQRRPAAAAVVVGDELRVLVRRAAQPIRHGRRPDTGALPRTPPRRRLRWPWRRRRANDGPDRRRGGRHAGFCGRPGSPQRSHSRHRGRHPGPARLEPHRGAGSRPPRRHCGPGRTRYRPIWTTAPSGPSGRTRSKECVPVGEAVVFDGFVVRLAALPLERPRMKVGGRAGYGTRSRTPETCPSSRRSR
ncbi:hypothetical protein BC793_111239 [Actinoplanes xinjiangensis]|uniref:Uncharacterized protein n=1 Tax=Actinoplanes xinjiangensis TaxID=512350 RepID=A0A316FAH5_9ACTN|nr:hypothetical protein BC793_111239 [Actinoplanes xinjiangensis]